MSDMFAEHGITWKVERSEGGPGIALGTDTAEIPYGAGLWFYGSNGEIRFLVLSPADLPSDEVVHGELEARGPSWLQRSRVVIPAP